MRQGAAGSIAAALDPAGCRGTRGSRSPGWLFIELGVITEFKTPVAEDKIVDRSFSLKAVGRG